MINSTSERGTPITVKPYPRLKWYPLGNEEYYVVLFDSRNSGMVVYNSKPLSSLDQMLGENLVGNYACNWSESEFQDYERKVVLENM